MSAPVLYELSDRVARLTLNRPESLNSLDLATVEALIAGATRAVEEGAGALVLTGSGRAFCSGADLSGALAHRGADGAIDIGAPMLSHFNPCARTFMELPIPVVVAVNGIAAGGGMSLALCGDIVIAARSASFRQTFSGIGLIPDLGATWLVPRLIGRARARGLALLGDSIDARTAADWGLIWNVVDDAELLAEAHATALRLSKLSTTALRATRTSLDASSRFEFDQQLAVEAQVQSELGREPAFENAVTGFLARKSGRSPEARCQP